MEGADELPNGYYGTSIRLSTAMDPRMKVMIAYKMNGEWLTPDHGRPLRVVIPGQIGGRSVKWLKNLIITNKPSENWYHIYDNRVLPTMLTPEMVDKDHHWWYDERYALYNLNVQSVICYPAHDEFLEIEDHKFYNVRGYAYNGGGIRIGRVEISLDQGLTWKLADISYPEDLYKEVFDPKEIFGGILDMKNDEECFCWCFWNINLSIDELSQAKDIVVRAMDESMNIQPRDIYWNVLSMLNNCWHRLTITKEDHMLKFEHPTLPGINQGGWMEKVKAEGGNLTDGFWGSMTNKERNLSKEKSSVNMKIINESITRIITEEELSKHNKDGDTWFAIHGHVYDASEYLKEHPGGSDSIISASGEDASEDFLAIHSDVAKSMLIKYHIGILQTTNLTTTNLITQKNREIFLDSKHWFKTILKIKKKINHDTFHLTFQLEHPYQKLGVTIGKHLYLQCRSISGEKIIRSYTPISDVDQLGQFELIIKLYRMSENQLAGKMSDCIDRLQEGDFVQCKGPFGDLEYKRKKIISYKGILRQVNQLTMIAGGSGITPIY
jgi:nitrate reductase (NAD(P)H)